MEVTRLDVLDVLSPSVWKKTLEIWNDLEKKRKRVKYATLQKWLKEFVDGGLAERMVVPPERGNETAIRGGLELAKYRLTPDGLRQRHEMLQKHAVGLAGDFLPSPA